jgi:hypothetical protein
VGAEYEGGEDCEASAVGGFGGPPDLVQVLPPVLLAGTETEEQVRGRVQRDDHEAFVGENVVKLLRAEGHS